MFELIDAEHDCFDYVNEDGQPTYVLSGQVIGIENSRTDSLVRHLQDSVDNQFKGFISVSSNLKQVTGYDYITEDLFELNNSIEIQQLIEIAIKQFIRLH